MTDEEEYQNNENIIKDETEDFNAGERFVHKKRRERKVRKGRLKQERFKIFVRFFVTVGLIFGLYSLMKNNGWYLRPDAFMNKNGTTIEVLNNDIVPASKVFAVLKTIKVPTVPIYIIKTNPIKNELLSQLKPIENVYIRRYAFPARLQIILRERTPVITIAPDENSQPIAFFTSDATLVGREFLPLNKKYSTILVLSYGNKGDDYKNWDLKKIKEIQKITKYIETYSKEQVKYLDFRNPDDVFVKIQSVNIRLGKIDENVFKRIERIPSIMPQVKDVNQKIKYLDLRWEKVNYLKLE